MNALRSARNKAVASLAVALTLGLVAASCGRENALVGGRCLEGYAESRGTCVFAAASDGSRTPQSDAEAGSDAFLPSTPDASDGETGVPPDASCPPPSLVCLNRCISVESDPFNCGACGRVCASRLCIERECVGETPGSIVLIGHGMTKALASSSRAALLRNAVTIPPSDPIRILAYDLGTSAQGALAVRTLIGTRVKNRDVVFSTATDADLDSDTIYATYDVVLFSGGLSGDAATLGTRWATALQTFTTKGGVLVALDSGEADIPTFLTSANLLAVGAHVAVADATELVVASPANVVGSRVPSPFLASSPSMAFSGAPPSTGDVVHVVQTNDLTPLPTVIHRIAR